MDHATGLHICPIHSVKLWCGGKSHTGEIGVGTGSEDQSQTVSLFNTAYLLQVVRMLEPISADFRHKEGHTLDKARIDHRAIYPHIYMYGQYKVVSCP